MTACRPELERPLGMFTRINDFGNGNLTMDDYINEAACHTAWYLYVADNMMAFSWNPGIDPESPPSAGGWLYGANPEDYVGQPPPYPIRPNDASWLDMASDFSYIYGLDSGPKFNGNAYMECQFPTWFSMTYDPRYGGFPGADDPTQPGDIWPN